VAFYWAWLFLAIAPLAQRSDTMHIVNHPTATTERLARIAACLRQATLLIEEIAPDIVVGLAPGAAVASRQPLFATDRPEIRSGNGPARPLIIDEATFSVHWANRTCYLGNTKPFRLMERLARRPNHLVLCDVLLEELWDQYSRSREVLRAAAKMLRRKLVAAGMEDLAKAIDGSTAHHYGLMLNSRFS
jgi:DNA-binding response OmpR family regulator